MTLIIATNKKQGEAADGMGTEAGTCLINKCRAKINQEWLYNVKVGALKKGAGKKGQEPEPPRPPQGERLLERTRPNSVRTRRLTLVR